MYNGGMSPDGKWRWTILERESSCSQWEGLACTHDGPWFFPFETIVGVFFGRTRVLVQAKNSGSQFDLGIEFSCNIKNKFKIWLSGVMEWRVLPFFLGGGGPQTNDFPSSWHVPQRVPNSTSLLSHMLWQLLSSFHLSTWVNGREA